MKFKNRLRLLFVSVAAFGTLTMGFVVPATSGAASQTLTMAEAPGASPNWIFPYMSCNDFSVNNINQFEDLMYRPL